MNRTDQKRTTKRKNKKNIILLSILIVILAIVGVVGGYAYAMFSKVEKVKLDKSNLGINDELSGKYGHITNIALFGVDSAEEGESGRSDSMMIATVDKNNKKLKVTSLMRDSYVDIKGHGKNKLNSAYAFGKEELAINTINENFDLNIENFVTVDFSSLPKIIDKIGGVDIDVDAAELKHINNYIDDLNNRTGTKSSYVSGTGMKRLNGVQAMAYCRIRYTVGDDYKRTERQREVVEDMLDKILKISPTKYSGLLNEILPMVKTSLSAGEILSLSTDVVSIGNNLEQDRFPRDNSIKEETINGMACLTFDKNTTQKEMHNWLFEDIK